MMLVCPLCEGSGIPLYFDNVNSKEYGQCSECELRFLRPCDRLSGDEEKAHYDLHNNDVHDVRYEAFVFPIYDVVKKSFSPEALGLDYGAGSGPVLAKMLRNDGYSVTLYDPIYWPDDSVLKKTYDFIMACEVAEHFFHPLAEFQRLHRLLHEGGTLVLMTLLASPVMNFEAWYYRKDPTHVVFYTEKTFTWIKNRVGFSSIETDSRRLVVLRK